MDKTMKVAILGFGTVGHSVARILCEHPPRGVELSCIFNRGIDRKRVSWVPSSVLWTDNFDQVLASRRVVCSPRANGVVSLWRQAGT
jgi:homoserine dehydrogenase